MLNLKCECTNARGPEQDLPDRLLGDFNNYKLEKIAASSQGKKYPARQFRVCAAHKTYSEMRYICKFCHAPLHECSCFEGFYLWAPYMQMSHNSAPKQSSGI
jgi:hypothetical protein